MRNIESVSYIYKGVRFIRDNKVLLKYYILQFVVLLVLASIAFYFTTNYGIEYLDSLIGSWLSQEWYMQTLYYILVIPLMIIFNFVSFYVVIISGQVLLAPINSAMSEKVEKLYTGNVRKRKGSFLYQIGIDILYEGKKVLFYALIFLMQMPLLLIWGFGSIAFSITSTISIMFMLSFDLLDYPMERDDLPFKKRLKLLTRNNGLWIGFGGGGVLVFMIPFMSILLMPAMVCGATLLYLDRFKKGE